MVFHIQQSQFSFLAWARVSPLIPLQAQPLLPPPIMVIWVPLPPPEMMVDPAVDLLEEEPLSFCLMIPLLVADFQMDEEDCLLVTVLPLLCLMVLVLRMALGLL